MANILDFFKSFSFEEWQRLSSVFQMIIGLASISFAILTYSIARKVRKEFLRNQALSKQMEVVKELISILNDCKIEVEPWVYTTTGRACASWKIKYNLFEIGDLTFRNEQTYFGSKNYNECDEFIVLFEKNSNQICDIKKFINNPFLPKNIGDELMNFYCSNFNIVKENILKMNEESIIVLRSGIYEVEKIEGAVGNHDLIEGNALVLKSWLNLKTHSNNLKQTFIEWFDSKGVNDINLRIDYKN